MTSATWTCPSCKRRVPNRVSVCHCGTTREQADRGELPPPPAAPPARARRGLLSELPAWSSLPWDLKALAIAFGLVVVLAVVVLFLPSRPQQIRPVLGWTDPTPPPPASPSPLPRSSPSPAPSPKHWKLPWSR
ncbi:MAG TPA: hypothetical protein VN461_18245 [Vicinamibacteria bacterium]|jgi:hypothetical protein|nr:hypothetical protein [Vicinamibacteria bacterium]